MSKLKPTEVWANRDVTASHVHNSPTEQHRKQTRIELWTGLWTADTFMLPYLLTTYIYTKIDTFFFFSGKKVFGKCWEITNKEVTFEEFKAKASQGLGKQKQLVQKVNSVVPSHIYKKHNLTFLENNLICFFLKLPENRPNHQPTNQTACY